MNDGERHPRHASLLWDAYKGAWTLRITKRRSPHVCQVAWCQNPPAYQRGSFLAICNKCRSRRYRANNAVRYAYEALKDSAKKRSIPFALGFDEFREWCEQTGYAAQKGIARLTNHCDRIRDNEGYHINNIQLLSQSENVRKQRELERQERLRKYEEENNNGEDPF